MTKIYQDQWKWEKKNTALKIKSTLRRKCLFGSCPGLFLMPSKEKDGMQSAKAPLMGQMHIIYVCECVDFLKDNERFRQV